MPYGPIVTRTCRPINAKPARSQIITHAAALGEALRGERTSLDGSDHIGNQILLN